MAGNVTAFNTVFTYELYQAYPPLSSPAPPSLSFFPLPPLFFFLSSFFSSSFFIQFNNIMDFMQLVLAFVNAPVFATFLWGMFWKRTTGHGAFVGVSTGIAVAALHHGLTLPLDNLPGVKGGWIAN